MRRKINIVDVDDMKGEKEIMGEKLIEVERERERERQRELEKEEEEKEKERNMHVDDYYSFKYCFTYFILSYLFFH